jgi:hypothetical protein
MMISTCNLPGSPLSVLGQLTVGSTEYKTANEDLVMSLSELVLDTPLTVECTDGGGLNEEV